MINAPAFNQRDGRWAGNRLGTLDGVSIGAQGCAITALTSADGADDPSNVWDPGQVDQLFTDQGGYVGYDGNGQVTLRSPQEGCGLLDWSAITRLLPNTNHAGADYCAASAAPVQKLRDWLDTFGQSAILEVRYGGDENAMHFVLAARDDNGVIVVMDPWNGDFTDVAGGRFGWPGNLGRIIYAVHYLSDTTPNVPVAPPPAPQPLPVPPEPVPAPPPQPDPIPAPTPEPQPEPTPPPAPTPDPEDSLNYHVLVGNLLMGRYQTLHDAYDAYMTYGGPTGQHATITGRNGDDITAEVVAMFSPTPAPPPPPTPPVVRPPHVDSATFKGIVTALQALGAWLIVALTDPTLTNFLNQVAPNLLPVIAGLSGTIAFLVGVLRKDVKLY